MTKRKLFGGVVVFGLLTSVLSTAIVMTAMVLIVGVAAQ